MHRTIPGIIASLLLLTAGCWAEGQYEDIRERTDYGNFSSVIIRLPADVIIEQEAVCHVEADIPQRLVNDITVRNDRGTLIMEARQMGINFFRSDNIRFIISMPQLEKLVVSGSGRVRSNDTWTNSRTEILSTGSANLEIEGVHSPSATLTTTGSGDLQFGSVQSEAAEVKTTGSGDISIETLGARRTSLITTGSGDLRINMQSEELTSLQTGSGDIYISGEALQSQVKTTGSGNFNGSKLFSGNTDVIITGSGDVSLMEASRLREIRITGSGSLHNF